MTPLQLAIEGMSCGHCLNAVTRSLSGLPGVRIESVRMGRADLAFDPDRIEPEAIVRAVEAAGYRATPVSPGQ